MIKTMTAMTPPPPAALAAALAAPVSAIGAGFMSDPELTATGADLGYAGIDFYLAGRAGLLGDVPDGVAAAALVFFAPRLVEEAWRRAGEVARPAAAAAAFAGCAHRWADHALEPADHVLVTRVGALAGRAARAMSAAHAPLFAGWRGLPWPRAPRPAATHACNALRELRMAVHASALLACGVGPGEAVRFRQPHLAATFGWEPDAVADGDVAVRWHRAEALTDEVTGQLLRTALGGAELAELVDVAAAVACRLTRAS